MIANSEAKIEMVKTISPTDVFKTGEFFSSAKRSNLTQISNAIFRDELNYQKKPLFCMTQLSNLWKLHYETHRSININNRNLNRLEQFFNEELSKIENLESKKNIQDSFNTIKHSISELMFDDLAIEIVESDSIKFTLCFNDNKTLMITKSTEIKNEFNDENLIFFTLFVNNKRLVSDYSDLSTFINGFQKYLVL